MICSLLLSLPLALSPQPVQDTPQAPVMTLDRLKSEIDTSLRWLRGRQDRETGRYGADEISTVRALLAFVSSPRAYRYDDGPYISQAVDYLLSRQAADGGFGAEELGTAQRVLITRFALRVFEQLGPETVGRSYGDALAFLDIEKLPPVQERAAYEELPDDRLLDLAAVLIERRQKEGSWDFPLDPVQTTASNVWRLNLVHSILKSRGGASGPKAAPEPLPDFAPADKARTLEALTHGAKFLAEAGDGGLWGFMGRPDPGITAMVAGALLCSPMPREPEVQQAIDRALDWLVRLQKPDGSIHQGQVANYVTSAAVMALARAGREGDAEVIAKARGFLTKLQADEGEGYAPGDRYYGGVGYGGDERPDLSNLQMALDALSVAGMKEGDETFDKALVFLQRCQNRSESNTFEVTRGGVTTKSGNDGGSGYAPGESKAGFIELPDGSRVPRSYGSMTYALLKGYLFAGLKKDDPRVQAVWGWLKQNYTLDINPGFEASADPTAAYQGLFYYFYTMARALDLYGEEWITDADEVKHPWRLELCGRLVAMQRQDGSWTNNNAERWYEGNPVLATSYAMLALDRALPVQTLEEPAPAVDD
jgi:squalene-hopene/tetraprenyl-beta-curcumene cyclase